MPDGLKTAGREKINSDERIFLTQNHDIIVTNRLNFPTYTGITGGARIKTETRQAEKNPGHI
jgi:hypothetical protein